MIRPDSAAEIHARSSETRAEQNWRGTAPVQWTLGGQLQHRVSNGSVPGVARETDSVDVKVISLRSPGQGGGQQYTGLFVFSNTFGASSRS